MTRPALVVVLLGAAACFPPPLDETGKRCSDTRPCGAGYFCLREACAPLGGPDDGGASDGGASDGGASDGGASDGGANDGGASDGGADDGGADDGGADDGGADGGAPDAGLPVDVNLLVNPDFEALGADGGLLGWRRLNGALSATPEAHGGVRAAKLAPTAAQPGLMSDPVPGPTALGMLFCAQLWVRGTADAGQATLTIRARRSDGGVADVSGGTVVVATTQWRRVQESYASQPGDALDVRLAGTRLDAGEALIVDDALLFLSSGTTCVFP